MPFHKRPLKEHTSDELLAKLEHFCAYRERSPAEVRRKLTDLGANAEQADQIFHLLEDEGFFNARRFAEAFAGGKLRSNHWGRVRIRMGLRAHQLDEKLVEHVLAELNEAEYTRIFLSVLEKKRRQLDGDPALRPKLIAYLLKAGFENDLIFAYL